MSSLRRLKSGNVHAANTYALYMDEIRSFAALPKVQWSRTGWKVLRPWYRDRDGRLILQEWLL